MHIIAIRGYKKYLFLFVIISNHSFEIHVNLKMKFIGIPMNQGY